MAAASSIKVLDARGIAKLVLSKDISAQSQLGFDSLSSSDATKVFEVFGTWIKQNIVDEQTYKTVYQTIGLPCEPDEKATTEQVVTAVNDLKEKLSSLKAVAPQKREVHNQDAQVCFLANTDRLLVTSGSELKVFAREDSQPVTDFQSFSNFARQPDDEIGLLVSRTDLNFVLEKVTWSTVNASIGLKFVSLAAESYDGRRIRMPYVLALESVHEIAQAVTG